jgi:hypothetical protein
MCFRLSPYELERIHHRRLRHIDHSLKGRVEIKDNKQAISKVEWLMRLTRHAD